MVRPTDLYIADLMNQAADALLAPIQHPSKHSVLATRLWSAAKAVRETAETMPQGYVDPEAAREIERKLNSQPQTWKQVETTQEQRFRGADGQGSFHNEKPR